MQKIKGRSSRVLQQEFPHLRKRYWGQNIWARGYFCGTVGQVMDQMIRDYIEGHVEKSPDDAFTLDGTELLIMDFSLSLDFQSVNRIHHLQVFGRSMKPPPKKHSKYTVKRKRTVTLVEKLYDCQFIT